MNLYAHLARTHWAQHRQTELAQIPDPDAFFEDLGRRTSAEIAAGQEALESQRPSSEDYLANLGGLMEARTSAESEVLQQLFAIPESNDPTVSTDR